MAGRRTITDSRAAWVIVAAAFTLTTVQCFNGVAHGVYVTEFIDDLGLSQAYVGILVAVRFSLMHLAGKSGYM